MKELLNTAWNVLLFRNAAYVEHARRPDVLKRGLLLLVIVSLIAAIIPTIQTLVNGLRPPQGAESIIQEIEDSFQQFTQFMPPEAMGDFNLEEMLTYMRPGIEMGTRIAGLPTPLPRAVGGTLTAVGFFLSQPFIRLAGWLGYAIWVLLAAKLLGGKGTVAQSLGATALYAVPHAFDLFSPIPCLGAVIGLVTTLWGLAIYVKALAAANEFGLGKAIVATLLPAVVGMILSFFGLLAMVAFIAISAG